MASDTAMRIVTGQIDFADGVDSGTVPTIAGPENPNGLHPTQVAWLINASCRNGGIKPRAGWLKTLAGFTDNAGNLADDGLFQGAFFYDYTLYPISAYPNIIFVVSGKIFRLNVYPIINIQDITNGCYFPPTVEKAYFCQSNEFLIISAGDYVTPNLVWDGRIGPGDGCRSINDPHWQLDPAHPIPVLPPMGPMAFFQGRIWGSISALKYIAGDIVYGPSANTALVAQYGRRDAVLHINESVVLNNGGSMSVPVETGAIRSFSYAASINTTLGQGNLFIGTRDAIYALQVGPDRNNWFSPNTGTIVWPVGTGQDPQLVQTVAMHKYGPISNRSVVPVNGDLFYMSHDGIRSLYLAVRNYQQWGQTSISNNIQRAIDYNDRSLMHMSSGILMDDRLFMTILPTTSAVGTIFKGIAVLDFDLITSIQSKSPPAWEGVHEGLDFLQIVENNFGGLQKAYAFIHSRTNPGHIEVWELTSTSKFDQGDNRIIWLVETPSYTWGDLWKLKQLDNAEFWFDQIYGTVDFDFYFRPDQDPCWRFWFHKQICAARSSCERATNPVCDYTEQTYCAQDRIPIVLPSAPGFDCEPGNNRPVNLGYQFQFKIVVRGAARLRGIRAYAIERTRASYEGLNTFPSSTMTALRPPLPTPPPSPAPGTRIESMFKNSSDNKMYAVNLQLFNGVPTWSINQTPSLIDPSLYPDYLPVKNIDDGNLYPVQLRFFNGVVDWVIGDVSLGSGTYNPDYVVFQCITDARLYAAQLQFVNGINTWRIANTPLNP